MKTVIYDHNIFSMQVYGGVSRYFCALTRILSKSGRWHPTVLAGLYLNQYLRSMSAELVKGVYLPRLPKLDTFGWRRPLNDRLVQKHLARSRPDIFHETWLSPTRLAPPSSATIITLHDMIHERLAEQGPVNPRIEREIRLKEQALKSADHIICISENTKRDLISMKPIVEEKISVIHHGCDLEAVQPAESNGSGQNMRPYILYVGERGDEDCHKNFTGLLKAYGQSARLKREFDLFCFGAGSFQGHEIERMRALNIPPDQVVHRRGSDRDLALAYQQAAVYVNPSRYEGFGLPLVEAMKMGCPLACSRASCFPEIAGEAATYFDPENSQEMALAIETLLSSESRQEQQIKVGKERAKSFTWQQTADKTMVVYDRVLAETE